MSPLKRAGALALAVSMLLAGPAGAATKKERARLAVHWLSHQQNEDGSFPGFSAIGSTADAVVSFAAAKRGPTDIDEAIGYLESHQAEIDSIGEIAKVVMALVAAGDDPRAFAGRDLVQEIYASQQTDGRFGASTPVLSHALAMIALAAAGEEPSGPERDWLLDAQCTDGGWQFDEPSGPEDDSHCGNGAEFDFTSETDATAYSVIALAGFKEWRRQATRSPWRFFRIRRDPIKDGWGYDRANPLTSSNSTALVIEAYQAHGHYKNVPDGAVDALIRLQYRLCGDNAAAFAFTYDQENGRYRKQPPDVGATIGAVLGLVPRPYDSVDVGFEPPEPEPC